MAQSEIDVDNATVTRSVDIAAPRGLVWAALTTPEQIAQWFGQRADFPDGVHEGAVGIFGWTGEADFPARIETYRPIEEFAFTWGTPGEELRRDNATTATFTLSDQPDGGTRLVVVESGFDTLAGDLERRAGAMRDNAQGWNSELDELVGRIEALRDGAAPVADVDAGTITHSLVIDADVETVWGLLIDPDAIESWWGHPAVFPDGLQQGANGTFEWVGHGLMPMRVERLDAPTTLDLLWGGLGDDVPGDDASLVHFTVAPAGGQTVVTVVETGFTELDGAARRAAMEDNVGGWTAVLAGLARAATRTSA